MKAVIYVVSFIVIAFIQTILSSSGVMLGALPTILIYLGVFLVAKKLSKYFDNKDDE